MYMAYQHPSETQSFLLLTHAILNVGLVDHVDALFNSRLVSKPFLFSFM